MSKRRERWIVEFEVDVESNYPSNWLHMNGQEAASLLSDDAGCLDAMPDGIHWHVRRYCERVLLWRILNREISAPEPKTQ